MTPNVLTNVPLYVGSLRIADMINTFQLGAMTDELDTTNAASDGYKEYATALKSADCSFSGFWRVPDGAENPDAYLAGKVGTSLHPVSVQQGGVAYILASVSTKHGWGAAIGQLSKIDLAFKGSAPLARGKVIEEYVGGADHNSAAVNLGAVAAGKRLYVAVHVFALTGTVPTLDLTIQSDADSGFASPVTRSTVPQFTAPGYYYTAIAGPITDTHYRVACNTGGTGPSTDYAVLLGIV